MKKNEPLVSICIPNYNYESTIAETIESALNQTYKNIEIIVLDNRSTDNSFRIARQYRKRGVRVYRNKNNIGVRSHNRLINLSKGKYVHILHSDDAVEPDFIQKCVALMENNENVGFTVTERQEVDAKSNVISMAPPFYNQSFIAKAENQRAVLMMASYFIPSETVFRRNVLEKVGLYEVDITNFMDWWLLYKCSCVSDMGCINEKLCRYRIWGRSDTSYMTNHMIMPLTGFLIRNEMLKFARRENDKGMIEREDMAIAKQADLTCKLGVNVIRNGDYAMGRHYLQLACAFNEGIKESPLFQSVDEYLNNEKKEVGIDQFLEERNLCGCRNQSYDPPKDFIPYHA